jgi:hypothetical protein
MARPAKILYEVNPETGCWDWQGALSWNGYGRIKRNNRLQWAHRFYYESKFGHIPESLQLDHLCRNTRCVNPDHLQPVTPAENQRRGNAVRFTWDAVEFIREHYVPYHPEYGQRALARKFNVSHAAVAKVIDGRAWSDKGGQ